MCDVMTYDLYHHHMHAHVHTEAHDIHDHVTSIPETKMASQSNEAEELVEVLCACVSGAVAGAVLAAQIVQEES